MVHTKSEHKGQKCSCDLYAETYTCKYNMVRHKKTVYIVKLESSAIIPVIIDISTFSWYQKAIYYDSSYKASLENTQ